MSSNKDLKNDEIDLLDLFRKMGRTISGWFKALGKGILICIIFLFRNWLPLGISLIIAVCLSFILKKTLRPYYASDITVSSNTVPNSDMISYINRLHSFCRENNYSAISEALSLPQEKGKEIKDIAAYWIIDLNNDSIPDFVDYKDNHNIYDSVNVRMKNQFDILIKISNHKDIDALKNSILSYIESNPFFRQKNEIRLYQIDEMLRRLNFDIGQLDSLQKVKYFEETRNKIPKQGGQIVFLQEQKTQLLYGDILYLFRQKQSLELEKKLNPEIITFLSDFTIPIKPYTGLLYYAKVLVPLIFGIALIILIYNTNRKKIKDLIRKY